MRPISSTACYRSECSLPNAPLSALAAGVLGPQLLILCLPACLLASWFAAILAGSGRLDAFGNPIGGDFAMFTIAGQMASQGEWAKLYDEPLQQARLLQLIPGLPTDVYLPYRYPPTVAILAAPLARLPYLTALFIFSCASLAVWFLSIWQLVRTLVSSADVPTKSAILAIATSPVMLQSLIDGQASMWWFAIAAGCWCALQHERPFSAGCFLALAACKPNVMLLLGVVLIVRYPRMLVGVAATGSAMLGLTWLIAGSECLGAYVELSKQLALSPWHVETPYWKVQSLLSWTELVVGPAAARRTNLVVGLIAAVSVGLWWRRRGSSPGTNAQALCAALLINALCNPYTPVYDLTLLCLGGLACVGCLTRGAWRGTSSQWLLRRDVVVSLGVLLVGPVLSQAIAKAARCDLQLLPICLLGVAGYWMLRWRVHAPGAQDRALGAVSRFECR